MGLFLPAAVTLLCARFAWGLDRYARSTGSPLMARAVSVAIVFLLPTLLAWNGWLLYAMQQCKG